MKSFLKENWFKIGILIIGAVIAYSQWKYYVYMPNVREKLETSRFGL